MAVENRCTPGQGLTPISLSAPGKLPHDAPSGWEPFDLPGPGPGFLPPTSAWRSFAIFAKLGTSLR